MNINLPPDAPLSTRSYTRLLLQILVLAAVYVVAGRLGNILAIASGYPSPIWPPAGIALAAILIYGYRVWPGILLGAFLVNGLNPVLASFVAADFSSLLVVLIIGIGASLQALIGAYWLKRYAGFPNALTQEKEVLLFLLYGGLLSALINSTLSVSVLVIAGRVAVSNFLENWVTWWVGDASGTIIFTPLILVWMLQNSEVWQNRRLMITLPTLSLFILTMVAVFYDVQVSNERIRLEFERQVVELNNQLKVDFFTHINVLRSIRSHYESSNSVSREEFRVFTRLLLDDFRGIQALEWAPVIQASEREVFEKSFQQDGQPGFQITERNINKTMQRAKQRSYYLPITFVEPYLGNENVWGYDAASNPNGLEAQNRAADTGKLSLTAPITLVQEHGNQQGLIAYQPIYHRDLTQKTTEQRGHIISGYAVAVFRVGDIVTAAFKNQKTAGLSYRLIDMTVPGFEQLLFSSDETLPPVVQKTAWFGAEKVFSSRLAIAIGGRTWQFEVISKPDYFSHYRSDNRWLILLSGLLLSSLVTLMALVGSGRGRMLQLLVSERTAELEQQHAITCAILQEKEQNHARLDLLLNSTGEGIYGIDPDGICIFINRAALTMLDYAAEQDVLGKNNHQLLHHSHPDGLRYEISDCPIYQALQGKISAPTDSDVYWRKDGSSFPIEYQAHPIKDGEKIIGCVISFIDITERKKTNATLTMLSMALEQSQSSVMITDLATHIEYVNEAFVKATGYSRKDILGRKSNLLSSKKTSQETYQAMWAALNAGKAWQGEVTNLNKQGEEFIELTWISPIRQADGNITHYLGVKEDITERKQLELGLLAAKNKAEALVQTKSQFLTNMSHEIRTPMNAIIGLSQLALNKEFDAEALDYLSKINRASVSLLGILNSILDLSKLEAGGMTLDQQPFYLDAMRDTLHSLFMLSAQEKDLVFTLNVEPDVPLLLLGDALRLRQVLINLLGNSIKFTERGAVTLNISLQESDASEARLLFCVKDTGIGMSTEDQAKLFQPFTQVDESSTRRFGGTGLGLVISKDLLSLMGSKLFLDSTPGQGSSFSFELVLAIPLPSLQSIVQHESETLSSTLGQVGSVLNGLRILAAEDNVFNQQIVRELLTLSGISVEIANNGEEALAMLAQQDFDAVLMDVHMPVMDGFEATKRIRSQPQFFTLPVIALTAGVTQEERSLCMAAGMNDFINKPINPSQLLSTLVQWLKPESITVAAFAIEGLETAAAKLTDTDQLPGFDMKNLLIALGNNQELASQLLLNFSDSIKPVPDEIDLLLAAGDLASAQERIHTLKGAAGNMGAVRLHAAAIDLEAELKLGSPTAEVIQRFKAAFDEAMSVVVSEFQPKAEPVNTGDAEALHQCAVKLDLLLEANDYVSETLISTLKTHLADEQLGLFIRLRKPLNELNYGEARKVLRELVTKLPEIMES